MDYDQSETENMEFENGGKDSDFNIDEYQRDCDSVDSSDSFFAHKEINDSGNGSEENESDREYIGPVLPGGHRFDKKFLCIRYPGNVVNTEKALETLGGIAAISKAVDTDNRRLELRFRPDDIFCKPACGDRHSTSAFLLRVRVKKSRIVKSEENLEKKRSKAEILSVTNLGSIESLRKSSETSNLPQNTNADPSNKPFMNELIEKVQNCNMDKNIDESKEKQGDGEKDQRNISPSLDKNKYEDLSKDEDYELPKLKVLGRIDTEFRFINLCDFQYLPITQNMTDPTKQECIYDSLVPINIPPYSWLSNKVPYFLPPAAFSRMDSVQQYVPKTDADSQSDTTVIGKLRKRRAGFSNVVHFTTPEVPKSPPKGIETAMKVKFLQNSHLDKIREIFKDRPIWSKNALLYLTKFTSEQLKILLPAVAYYCMTGPWRIMWVKLGYDPRKDPSARKYQILDYRLKAMHGLEMTVKCKRNYADYNLPYKSAPSSKPKTTILTDTMSVEQRTKTIKNMNEDVYIYREGMVPPSRQMFYQYCDVLTDDVQEMLAKLPDPPPGTKCHEKRGWLPSGFDDQCREIINKQVRAVLRKKMNIPEDHPTTLPRKRKIGVKLKPKKMKVKQSKKNVEQRKNVESKELISRASDDEWDDVDINQPSTSTGIR